MQILITASLLTTAFSGIALIALIWKIHSLSQSMEAYKANNDRLTSEFRDWLQSAELSVKLKSEFLSRANHEMRNPLQAMIGYSELLNSAGTISEQQRHEFLSGIVTAGQLLAHLVNELMEVIRVRDGVLSVHESNVDIVELFRSAQPNLVSSTQHKNLKLEFSVESDGRNDVFVDETVFRQIFLNTVSNIIRLSNEGTVIIKLMVKNNGDNRRLIAITVLSKQLVIPPHVQERLFQPIAELPSDRFGRGLGLYMSKALVELLGGDIHLISAAETGTQITIELDLPEASSKTPVAIPRSPEIPLKIVVVDDKQLIRRSICETLEQLGHNAAEAEALDSTLSLVDDWNPDLVMLDLRMPGKSSFDYLTAIRERSNSPTMIAMTGDASVENRQQALDAGFDFFLAKPFLKTQLSKAIDWARRN